MHWRTNFTSDWRKLFNPRCYIGISVGAGALQGRKYVRSESGRRCNHSLPKSPLLLVARNCTPWWKKTSWRNQERREMTAKKEKQRAIGRQCVAKYSCPYMPRAVERSSSSFGHRDYNSQCERTSKSWTYGISKFIPCCTVNERFISYIKIVLLNSLLSDSIRSWMIRSLNRHNSRFL